MRPLRSMAAALAACILCLAMGCLLDGKQAGRRGSEVENEVYGVLVTRDGGPAAGARVRAVPGDTSTRIEDSVLTGPDGKYSFRGLPPGTYNLQGDYDSGSLVVFIPAIEHADTRVPLSVGVDTLLAPGRIRGRLLLGDSGFGGAMAYLPGTSYLAISDDSGRFVLTGVPQGRYTVKYAAPGYLVEPDTAIFVASGTTVDLPVKRLAADPAFPPPTPFGLTAVFDTLRGRSLLSWRAVEVSDLDGYLIYRDVPGEGVPRLVAGGFTRDTVFVDSSLGDPAAIAAGPIAYLVKAKDREANASLNFSGMASAPGAPGSEVVTALSWLDPLKPGDTIPVGDRRWLHASFSNPTRATHRLAWSQSGRNGDLASRAVDAKAGADSLAWLAEPEGELTVTLAALDAGGAVWKASRTFHVAGNDLRASAGNDTTVSLGDSLALHATASSRFGRYVSWQWDVAGTGHFTEAGPGDFRIRAPASTGDMPCVLSLVDRFGDTALDTAWVHVLADAPKVIAAGDTTVSLGDSVRVSAEASDAYGRVVKLEWKACGDTAFREGPAATHVTLPRIAHPACAVIARATDDDGQRGEDTVTVAILADAPMAEAKGDTAVSLGDTVRVAGSATDRYGRIVKWEWMQGPAGAFIEGGPAARFAVPRIPEPAYPIILRATDDDGQSGLDTVRVVILADPPVAKPLGDDSVSLQDSVTLEARGDDGFGRIVSYAWSCGADAPFLPADPGRFRTKAPSAAMRWPCALRVIDDDGQAGVDTVWIEVVADPPRAIATASKGGAIPGEKVAISAAGSSDRFGRIVRWEWDIGATGVFKPSGPDTLITLPSAIGPLRCVLRVTDEDGLTGRDTVVLQVISLAVDAGKDTSLAPSDTLHLRGKGLPGFGTVAKWEWDIGGTGAFRPTSTGDTSFQLPIVGASFTCVLRATNTLGYAALDTLKVIVDSLAGVSTERFRIADGLKHRLGSYPVEFQDKLWILGGLEDGLIRNDVWSSDDGINWIKRVNAAHFSPVMHAAAVAYKGRLWLIGGTTSDIAYKNRLWKMDGTQSVPGVHAISDVWSSVDGIDWVKAPYGKPLPPRIFHEAVVFQGKLCVMGSDYYDEYAGRQYPQSWCSENGSDWELLGGLPDFRPQLRTAAAVGGDGKLYARSLYAGLQQSRDGLAWTPIPVDFSSWELRGMFLAGNEIWTIATATDNGKYILRTPIGGGKGTSWFLGQSQLYDEEILISFRGQPLIWWPNYTENGVNSTVVLRVWRYDMTP